MYREKYTMFENQYKSLIFDFFEFSRLKSTKNTNDAILDIFSHCAYKT